MTFENIPNEIKESIINPLLEIEAVDRNSMKNNLDNLLEGTIIPQIENYFNIMEKNLEWFLDLEERQNFENYLFKKDSSTFRTYFRKYNNLVNFLSRKFLEKTDPKQTGLIEKLNDIYLEFDQRRGYYYNVKFYHYNESILDLKENIKRIVNKALRLEVIERKHDLGSSLPRWSSFEYSLEPGTSFNIDFIENILEVNHNNIYISTYFFKEKKCDVLWEKYEHLINEKFDSLTLNYQLPNSFEEAIDIFDQMMKKLRYVCESTSPDWILLENGKNFVDYMIQIAVVMDIAYKVILHY